MPAHPIENAAPAPRPSPRPRVHKTHLHVLLVGAESQYLEAAFLTIGDVTVDKVASAAYTPARLAGVDVVVFNDYTPGEWPATADLVLIHPTDAPIALRRGTVIPHAITVTDIHPVMRYIELADVRIDRSQVFDVIAERGEIALASTDRGDPIIAAKDDGQQRVVAFGFALEDSDLPLHTAFPLMLRNALAWFAD